MYESTQLQILVDSSYLTLLSFQKDTGNHEDIGNKLIKLYFSLQGLDNITTIMVNKFIFSIVQDISFEITPYCLVILNKIIIVRYC